KLPTHAKKYHQGCSKKKKRRANYNALSPQGKTYSRLVQPVEEPHDALGDSVLSFYTLSEKYRGNHRHISQAQDHSAQHGKAKGQGHGGEHFALDTCQRKNGNEDNQDDNLPKDS